MKKKIIGVILSMLLINLIGLAQGNKAKAQEKVEARKIAFITNKLQLSPAEAQKFWPLYNEYQANRQETIKDYKVNGNFNLMSDAEIASHVDRQFEKEEKLLDLKKGYIHKLKEVLPIRKVAMLPRIERRFKEWVLDQIKQRRAKN